MNGMKLQNGLIKILKNKFFVEKNLQISYICEIIFFRRLHGREINSNFERKRGNETG